MLTSGDSDRYETVGSDEDSEDEEETGVSYAPQFAAVTPPETPGEPEVSETTEQPAAEEMVKVHNLTRLDVQILVRTSDGNETQVRLARRSSYGPIARSRLTPQVESLQTNNHVRIESQN